MAEAGKTYLEPTQESGRALFMRGIVGSVVMLNLIRLREVADYSLPGQTHFHVRDLAACAERCREEFIALPMRFRHRRSEHSFAAARAQSGR